MNSISPTKSPTLPLIALAGTMLLASLGISITSVALPTLSKVFAAPVSAVQWVVLIYLIAATVAIVLAGRCGDLFGHRFMLIIGLIIFTMASVLCAIAPTLITLIAARAVQGIGGAILMALPISIVRDMVTKEKLGSAMGLLGTMSALGTALGPSLGGILITGFGWRSAFVMLAALSFLIFVFTLRTIPAGVFIRKPQRSMDISGAILLSITLVFYALATSGAKADAYWSVGFTLPAALIALFIFIIVEVRSPAPLVPVAVLRNASISSSLITNMIVTTVMMSTLVVGPFFLSFGLQLNDAMVGLVMAVGPVTAALAGIPAGRTTDRLGAHMALKCGLTSITISLICLALLPVNFGVGGYVFSLIILTPGFQLFLAANNTALMATAPEEQRGILSGLLGLSRNLGFMTGASVMATVFATTLGTEDVAQALSESIAYAFTATFLVAAGLAMLGLILALVTARSGAQK